MDKKGFELLDQMERSWWYHGRMATVRMAISKLGNKKTALDFGAGLGGMKSFISEFAEDIYAFDPGVEAKNALLEKKYKQVFSTLDDAMEKKYDYIFMFDVLEHIEDDLGFLKKLYEKSPSGKIVLTVPAFMFLWNDHDVKHQHFRRYTKHSLSKALKDNGYSIDYIRYWNVSLFPVLLILRLFGFTGESSTRLPKIIDKMLYAMIFVESAINKYLNIPFGVSLVCVASPK